MRLLRCENGIGVLVDGAKVELQGRLVDFQSEDCTDCNGGRSRASG